MIMNRAKLLDAFIRQNLFALLSLAGASAIFLVVIVLYRLPAESVGYASLLAAFFLPVVGVVRFGSFCKKHCELEALRHQIAVPAFPLPETSPVDLSRQSRTKPLSDRKRKRREHPAMNESPLEASCLMRLCALR